MKIGIAKLTAVVALTALSFGALTSTSYGQARPSSKTNVLSVNVLGLAISNPLEVGYEWKSGPTNSWLFKGYFWPVTSDITAFGLGAAYRIYIADSRALTGLAVAPAADVFFFNWSSVSRTFTSITIGGDLSYKWIFDQFAVEPFFGVRIGFAGDEGVSVSTGFRSRLGLNLGYAW